jgi:hypothetical protein
MMDTDEAPYERLVDAVAAELKRPVPIAPELDQRVMNEIRARRGARTRKRMLWSVVGVAFAAGVAGIIFARKAVQPFPAGNAQPTSFTLEAPTARRVALVGDFNNWDPHATPLRRVSASGRWEIVVPLSPGRYQFTFMVDGTRWVADPHAPAVSDDFGEPTSAITILPTARL